MKKLLHLILPALLLGAPSAQAGDNVVMVELFTSQGCSSCPPADRNLAALAARDDVLALSLHVDYWDYLGWRDTFGSPEHTRRQYAYRESLGARVVYTPQVIVHGTLDVPGYHPDRINDAIAEIASTPGETDIAINGSDGMMAAQITKMDNPRPCTIWIASYSQSATVEIRRGENAGKAITYHNVVDKLLRVGSWRGSEGAKIDLPQPGPGQGVAVWLQDDATGRIVAASFIEG